MLFSTYIKLLLPLLIQTLSHTIYLLMIYICECLLLLINIRVSSLHTSCIDDKENLATANLLKLNDNKTELMLVTS